MRNGLQGYVLIALFSIVIAFFVDRSGRTPKERTERRGYSYVYGDGTTGPKEERSRYTYGVPAAYLPVVFIFSWIFSILLFGIRNAISYQMGSTVSILISICLYYIVLLPFLPLLRDHIRPMGIASLWVIPNILYISFYAFMTRNVPVHVLTVPRSVLFWAYRIWLLGFVLFLGRAVFLHLRFRKTLLSSCVPCENADLLASFRDLKEYYCGSKGEYRLLISKELQSPLSIGMFRRTICVVLPDRAYAPEDADLIFRHELIHICRNDGAVKFFLTFCTALCWFNPLMYKAMRYCSEDLELSCDQLVLQDVGEENTQRYASLILESAGEPRGFTTCLAASAQSLRYRLTELLKKEKKNASGALLAGISVFLMLICLGSVTLAWDAGTVGSVIHANTEDNVVSIRSAQIFEKTGKYSQKVLAEHCSDPDRLLDRLDSMPCEEMLCSYRVEREEKTCLSIYAEADGQNVWLAVYDHYATLNGGFPSVQRCFYLPESVDWDVLFSLFE